MSQSGLGYEDCFEAMQPWNHCSEYGDYGICGNVEGQLAEYPSLSGRLAPAGTPSENRTRALLAIRFQSDRSRDAAGNSEARTCDGRLLARGYSDESVRAAERSSAKLIF